MIRMVAIQLEHPSALGMDVDASDCLGGVRWEYLSFPDKLNKKMHIKAGYTSQKYSLERTCKA